MQTYTLKQFTTFIRRMLALNLPEAIWVTAELAQVSDSRGHLFFTLTEKEEHSDQITAQTEAVIWASQRRKIIKERGLKIEQLFQEGLEVKLRVSADFHDRYGFKLVIEDVDPVHTLGKLEQQRQATLKLLEADGVLDKQQALSLAAVPQRIAVISSESAAGYADFKQQLLRNSHYYAYDMSLFPAAMQGELAVKEIKLALNRIARRKDYFDLIVIIRGGGAKMDLIAFDDESLCRAVADAPLPVITGIGHEIDEVLLDYVAYGALKTPTAVAAFLIDCSANLEAKVMQYAISIQHFGKQQIAKAKLKLALMQSDMVLHQKTLLNKEKLHLGLLAQELPAVVRNIIQQQQLLLENENQLLSSLHPDNILKRGYVLLAQDGKRVQSVQDLQDEKPITATFKDGETHLKKL